MQPDQKKNYWEKDSNSDEISEMYTPNGDEEESEPSDEGEPTKNSSEKHVDDEPIHWSASEYIPGEKNALWFILFAIVVLALVAGGIFFLKEYTFSVLVVVMAVAVIVYSRRPPREIDYTISGDQGLYVGEKLYHFGEFKAFGLISDQGHHTIMLIPIKRFSVGVSVYFPEEVGEKIVDILGARLPMEKLKLDFIDNVVRKLRL